MIPILAACLTGATCFLTARLLRSGEWSVWTAAAVAALAAMLLPPLHAPGMTGVELLASDLARAAAAALAGSMLGASVIVALWWRDRRGD